MSTTSVLAAAVELAQQRGAYELSEADLLKRAIDVFVNGAVDAEIVDAKVALSLMVQGVHKGQMKGCYSLVDASNIFNALKAIDEEGKQATKTELEPSKLPLIAEELEDEKPEP
jgi:hypothetical protein